MKEIPTLSKKQKDYGLTFWIHLIFVLIAYISPLLVPWWLIAIGVFILQMQFIVFKGCVLTKAEFGPEDETITFIGYYLQKWNFLKRQTRKTKIWIRYISPIIILIISLILQLYFNIEPLLNEVF